jgi:hypothetical protein
MGGNNSTSTQTTTIVNDIFNSSVSTVLNKNVMMVQASISTDQDALNIVSSSISGDINFSGLKIDQESNLTMDLDATLTSIDNTDITKDISTQMLNDAKASMAEQDSVIPAGLFGDSSDTNMETTITTTVTNIIETNVTSDDVKECCSSLVAEQTAASVIVGRIEGSINASGLEISQIINATTIQNCVFDSEKTTQIVETISAEIDNKLETNKRQQNLIGSAGTAYANAAKGVGAGVGAAAEGMGTGASAAAQGVGTGVSTAAQGVGDGVGTITDSVGKIFGMDTSTAIVIGIVAIAVVIGGIIYLKQTKGGGGGRGYQMAPPMNYQQPIGPQAAPQMY